MLSTGRDRDDSGRRGEGDVGGAHGGNGEAGGDGDVGGAAGGNGKAGGAGGDGGSLGFGGQQVTTDPARQLIAEASWTQRECANSWLISLSSTPMPETYAAVHSAGDIRRVMAVLHHSLISGDLRSVSPTNCSHNCDGGGSG